MKNREQKNQRHPFMKAALHADLEKIKRSLQGEEFRRNVLPFALDYVKLLDLGDSIQEIPGLVDPAAIGGNNLGVRVVLAIAAVSSPCHFDPLSYMRKKIITIYLLFPGGMTYCSCGILR